MKNNILEKRYLFWLDFARRENPEKVAKIIAQKEYEADRDQLSGLLNRRGLFNEIFNYIRIFNRNFSNIKAPFNSIIISLDLKGLKEVNDKKGYKEGDLLIRKAAQLLKETVYRPSDIVSRIGGDEFLVVLINTGDMGLKLVLRRIKKLSDKYKVYFHIVSLIFKSNEKIIDVVNEVNNLSYDSKTYLKKDITGRLIGEETTIVK